MGSRIQTTAYYLYGLGWVGFLIGNGRHGGSTFWQVDLVVVYHWIKTIYANTIYHNIVQQYIVRHLVYKLNGVYVFSTFFGLYLDASCTQQLRHGNGNGLTRITFGLYYRTSSSLCWQYITVIQYVRIKIGQCHIAYKNVFQGSIQRFFYLKYKAIGLFCTVFCNHLNGSSAVYTTLVHNDALCFVVFNGFDNRQRGGTCRQSNVVLQGSRIKIGNRFTPYQNIFQGYVRRGGYRESNGIHHGFTGLGFYGNFSGSVYTIFVNTNRLRSIAFYVGNGWHRGSSTWQCAGICRLISIKQRR